MSAVTTPTYPPPARSPAEPWDRRTGARVIWTAVSSSSNGASETAPLQQHESYTAGEGNTASSRTRDVDKLPQPRRHNRMLAPARPLWCWRRLERDASDEPAMGVPSFNNLYLPSTTPHPDRRWNVATSAARRTRVWNKKSFHYISYISLQLHDRRPPCSPSERKCIRALTLAPLY